MVFGLVYKCLRSFSNLFLFYTLLHLTEPKNYQIDFLLFLFICLIGRSKMYLTIGDLTDYSVLR